MKPTIFSSQNTIRYNEKSKFEEKILIFEILRKNLKSIPKLGHVTLLNTGVNIPTDKPYLFPDGICTMF